MSISKCGLRRGHFYPRPPRGGRLTDELAKVVLCLFLSTPSARRATQPSEPLDTFSADFYPRPTRGGRPRKKSSTR